MGTWTSIAPMSIVRSNFESQIIDNKIYVLGGSGSGSYLASAEVYDPVANAWSTLASMSTSRSRFKTEVLGEKIYAIGGTSDNGLLSSIEVYDPTSNAWVVLASMPTARRSFETEVIEGKIYVIGGANSNNIAFSAVEVYDPVANAWKSLAAMTTARHSFRTAVVNGKIYAIGGYDQSKAFSSVEVYDPVINTWEPLASMHTVRWDFQSEVIDGKIYVMGGLAPYHTSSTEVYNPTTNTWATLASMSTARRFFETEVIEGKIYAVGGITYNDNTSSYEYLSLAELYDPSSNVWTTLPAMSVAREFFQTNAINGNFYVLGGVDGAEALASAEVLAVVAIVAPTSLTASGRDSNVDLSWGAIADATSYNVYRALTSGGPYTQIAASVTATTYTDSDVTNGTTYYYVVTAVSTAGESTYSNEASAMPNADETGKALLDIYMVDNILREYDLPMSKVNEFIDWYKLRAAGTGDPFFMIEKTYNKGSFSSRKDYIVFDKIRDFEVNQ
ncbi:MAG: kelch repeat-containing protein [Candidatus Fimivivens sp.]|nr:kelch repeat-containing protein [Candidatus Fimivivens sp.]